jgi:urease accessory protein
MTLLAREIIGTADEPRFARRRVERVSIHAVEAERRRLRRVTDAGTDVALDLPAGAYLADGAVLVDDGTRIVVVRRPPEPALVVRLDRALAPETLVEQAARLGHAFGNQHVPVEVDGCEVRVHLTTSMAIARATVERLGLERARIEEASVALARERPAASGHGHGH